VTEGNPGRAHLYAALARAFGEPGEDLLLKSSDNPLLRALGAACAPEADTPFRALFERLWSLVEKHERGPAGTALERLQVEYARLFLGPPSPLVFPYEHAHVRGDAAVTSAALAETYRRNGFAASAGSRDLRDHISLELEFTAALLEAGRARDARGFVADHLAPFAPSFAREVRSLTRSELYRIAADSLSVLIGLELQPVEEVRATSGS